MLGLWHGPHRTETGPQRASHRDPGMDVHPPEFGDSCGAGPIAGCILSATDPFIISCLDHL